MDEVSGIILVPQETSFTEHPQAEEFLKAAFANDGYGIADQERDRLVEQYELTDGEAAALSYLASKRVSAFRLESELVEFDIALEAEEK